MKYAVAGIYVERNKAVAVRANAERMHPGSQWSVEYLSHATVSWNPNDQLEAKNNLLDLMRFALEQDDKLNSLAIGAYGPFLSLIPFSEGYGEVHPVRAHLPFRGISYIDLFKSAVEVSKPETKPFFSVHTDASACAIGEAMTRDLPLGKVVASILIGKGIGLGLMLNHKPIPSALHPEIGLLPATISSKDTLQTDQQRSMSLAELAANDAMCQRAGISLVDGNDHPDALRELNDEKEHEALWDLRAEYLAQACLACSAICPPNLISLHPYVDPLGDVGERTAYHFNELVDRLKLKEQPVFRYEDLQAVDFISTTKQQQALNGASPVASTGVMGLCYAAADYAFDVQFNFAERLRTPSFDI